MRKDLFRRLLSGLLAFVMIFGTFSVTVFADDGDSASRTAEVKEVSKLDEIKELLNTASYSVYRAGLSDKKNAPGEFTVNMADAYAPDNTDSTAKGVEIKTNYEGRNGKSIYLPEEGRVAFKIDVPADGFYALEIEYYSEKAKATSIERMFYLDGAIPFSEARYVKMTKTWIDNVQEDGSFKVDITGNEIRPTKSQQPVWNNYTVYDSSGLVLEPLQFYLTKGEHTVALEAVREPFTLGAFRFFPYEEPKSYQDQLAEWRNKGYKNIEGDTKIYIAAEKPVSTSDQTIYPLNDRSSPISEPQDANLVKLNTIGSDKWENAGQWIKYEVNAEKAGLYELVLRYKQDTLEGMYSTRRIYINGKVPFEEANHVEFSYSDKWNVSAIGTKVGSEENKPYLFYLNEGKNEVMFEVALGSMSEVLTRVNGCLTKMNNSYLKILMITGSTPDSYRDYQFDRLIPQEIRDLKTASSELTAVSELLTRITGNKGAHVATLDKVVVLLERMTSSEDEIAKNLTNLKSYIGTLGTWVLESRAQPLELDYFAFQAQGLELPEADAGFFKSFAFEFRSFILSFFTDYSTLGATRELDTDKTVSIWTSTGREKSNILRQLIDTEFMPTSDFAVELKLVSGGVLQSTLAGIGPDISSLASQDCMNYAIRDAVLPITDMDGFDEVIKRFPSAALTPLTLEINGKEETFALPNTMTFLMMFYRMDILSQLGVEVPKTWDELKRIIPTLQNNNMTLGFPSKLTGLKLFLYQMGGEMYAENGKRSNLSSNVALSAFTELTDLFQSYRFPLTYDAANRFRTGEMPIIIADYISLYNQLTVFAPEIEGMWEFSPLPGFENANGDINNCAVVTVTGLALLRGAMDNKEDAWTFLKWYTSGETQSSYSNELVAIVGQSSKNATANRDALMQLPWTARELGNLTSQFEKTVGITEYPGGYIIARYVDFAFMNVYKNNASPVESLLDYVTEINKEITRKRKEFGFDYIEISYSEQFIEEVD